MVQQQGDNPLLPEAAPPRPPPGMVGAGKLARALNVTRMTVTNYVRAGMPHTELGGQRWFDVQACVAWARMHKAHVVEPASSHHGGLRPGAGRTAQAGARKKARAARSEPEPGQAFDQSPLGQAAKESAQESQEPTLMKILAGRSISDPGVIQEVIGRVKRADAETLGALLEASARDMSIKIKRGELVDRAVAAATMQEVLTGLVHAIDGLPGRLADLAQVGLPPVAGDRGQSAEPMDAMMVARLRAAAERLVTEIRQRAAAVLEQRGGGTGLTGSGVGESDAGQGQQEAA